MNKQEQKIEEMVRDFCSVVPKSKSEVRRRISESIAQTIANERERLRGEIEERLNNLPKFGHNSLGTGEMGTNLIHLLVRVSDVQGLLSSLDKLTDKQ